MNGCRDGLLPRESAWWAWAKPWMMNNDSVPFSPQELLRLRLAIVQMKSCWQAPLNQRLNLITARCGWGLLTVGDITCLREDPSSRHRPVHLKCNSKYLVGRGQRPLSKKRPAIDEDWSAFDKRKTREKGEEEGKDKGKKIKENVCKLTLTAQQGARVDRGERWSDLLTQAKDRKRASGEARETKQIQSSFPSRGKP